MPFLGSLGSDLSNLADPWKPQLLHLDSELEEIIKTAM
jgi:hypothetical protein